MQRPILPNDVPRGQQQPVFSHHTYAGSTPQISCIKSVNRALEQHLSRMVSPPTLGQSDSRTSLSRYPAQQMQGSRQGSQVGTPLSHVSLHPLPQVQAFMPVIRAGPPRQVPVQHRYY